MATEIANDIHLKIDIQDMDLGFIIGKDGRNINKIKQMTGCSVHFPDKLDEFDVSHCKVAISGEPFAVEKARLFIRETLPVRIKFPVQVSDITLCSSNSEKVKLIEKNFKVNVKFSISANNTVTVQVYTTQPNFPSLQPAIEKIWYYLTNQNEICCPRIRMHLTAVLRSYELENLCDRIKQIESICSVQFLIPPTSTYTGMTECPFDVFGDLENMFKAWKMFMSALPASLTFYINGNVNFAQIKQIVQDHEIYVFLGKKTCGERKIMHLAAEESKTLMLFQLRNFLLTLIQENEEKSYKKNNSNGTKPKMHRRKISIAPRFLLKRQDSSKATESEADNHDNVISSENSENDTPLGPLDDICHKLHKNVSFGRTKKLSTNIYDMGDSWNDTYLLSQIGKDSDGINQTNFSLSYPESISKDNNLDLVPDNKFTGFASTQSLPTSKFKTNMATLRDKHLRFTSSSLNLLSSDESLSTNTYVSYNNYDDDVIYSKHQHDQSHFVTPLSLSDSQKLGLFGSNSSNIMIRNGQLSSSLESSASSAHNNENKNGSNSSFINLPCLGLGQEAKKKDSLAFSASWSASPAVNNGFFKLQQSNLVDFPICASAKNFNGQSFHDLHQIKPLHKMKSLEASILNQIQQGNSTNSEVNDGPLFQRKSDDDISSCTMNSSDVYKNNNIRPHGAIGFERKNRLANRKVHDESEATEVYSKSWSSLEFSHSLPCSLLKSKLSLNK